MSTTTNTEEKDKQLTVEGAVGNTLTPAQIEAGKQMYADIQAGYDEQYEAMEQAQNDNLELEKKATEAAKKKLDDAAHDEMQAAYTDYQRETGKYGVNAEAMAASGMSRTGYSESARVRAYAAYQNRVATTKAALAAAKSDYDLKMQQAVAQNNVALAEIAFASFQQRTELLISQFNSGLYEYEDTALLEDNTNTIDEETPAPFYSNGVETPTKPTAILNPNEVKYGAPENIFRQANTVNAGSMVSGEPANDILSDVQSAMEKGYEIDTSQLSYFTDETLADAIESGDVEVKIDNNNKTIVFVAPKYGTFNNKAANELADLIQNPPKGKYNFILGKNKLPEKYRKMTWAELADAVRRGEITGVEEGKNLRLVYVGK